MEFMLYRPSIEDPEYIRTHQGPIWTRVLNRISTYLLEPPRIQYPLDEGVLSGLAPIASPEEMVNSAPPPEDVYDYKK